MEDIVQSRARYVGYVRCTSNILEDTVQSKARYVGYVRCTSKILEDTVQSRARYGGYARCTSKIFEDTVQSRANMEDMYREKQFKYIIYSISIKSIFTFKFFLFIFLQHTTQHQYLYKQSRIRYKG